MGVIGTSSSQVALMLKEKAAFLQKHDQALFGKDFRDHLTESLKAKKQSIDAIAEVSKSTNRKRPFREGPSFYQGRPNGGQKFRSSYNGKHILFQKKGTLSQHQQNFTSNYDNHGGINSCSSNSKKIIFHSKNSKLRPSKEDKGISPSLETIDKRSRTLGFSKGYLIPLVMDPVQEKAPKVPKLNQEQQKQVDLEVKAMLGKGSISIVCHSKEKFLSSMFLISKIDGGNRSVINLKDLNWFIPYGHFKMEGSYCLKYVLQKGDYISKIYLKDILQRTSTQRFTKIITVSLGRKLVRVPVPMLWFGTSSQNIHKIIKGPNFSFETSDDKGHNLSRRFIDFKKECERLCDLPISTSRLCDKSEETCVRSCTRNRVLRADCEFPNYDFVITRGKDKEDNGSMPDLLQSIRGISFGFDKTNRNTLFNHSNLQFRFLLLTTSIAKTNIVLHHFRKADSHDKKRVVMVG